MFEIEIGNVTSFTGINSRRNFENDVIHYSFDLLIPNPSLDFNYHLKEFSYPTSL